jgi:muconolactone delta-isomerase
MSDYYDLPFNDILDWDKFSVILKEDDVLELEKILKSIPERKYEKMHQNVLKVDMNFIFIWD